MADVNLYYGQHFRKNHKNIFEEKIIENFGNENLTLKMAIFLFRPCPLCYTFLKFSDKSDSKQGSYIFQLVPHFENKEIPCFINISLTAVKFET